MTELFIFIWLNPSITGIGRRKAERSYLSEADTQSGLPVEAAAAPISTGGTP